MFGSDFAIWHILNITFNCRNHLINQVCISESNNDANSSYYCRSQAAKAYSNAVFTPIFGAQRSKIYESHLQTTFREGSPLRMLKGVFLRFAKSCKLTSGGLPQNPINSVQICWHAESKSETASALSTSPVSLIPVRPLSTSSDPPLVSWSEHHRTSFTIWQHN
jgi:hypothetical protein